jgi:hypothetical protein
MRKGYDLRERFDVTVSEFAQVLEKPLRPLAFIIDRGIHGRDTLDRISRNGDTLVTWEKGYRYDGWKNDLPVLHFRTSRYRKSFQDTIS